MAVKFIDNTAIVVRKMDANCSKAMQAVAGVLVESVQGKMLYGYPTAVVDTGALFDSIEASPDKVSQNTYGVNVGTNLHYASYVHDGTRKMTGRPFIKDGVMEASGKVREVLSQIIPNGFIS